MNNREKLLGGLVLAILVGFGARSVHTRLDATYDWYVNQEEVKEDELFKAEIATSTGMQAAERLNEWKSRSLPSDETYANLGYQFWLLEQFAETGLEVDTPKVNYGRSLPDKFTSLNYTIQGEGTLEALTDFLYNFYRASHLHKISKLTVTPDDSGGNLALAMTVEALSLADADRYDTLAEGEFHRLALESVDEYHDAIVGRNIFAVYKPKREEIRQPRPPQPAAPPPFDHAKHARATGIVESNDKPQVWILVETTGDRHRLFEGESFKINDLEVKILKINVGTRTIVYEADGQQYMVKLGKKNFRDGEPLDGGQTS